MGGFSLVEILAVVSIMVIITALAVPMMNSLKGAGNVTKAVYDIKGILDQARTCAIANNAYVWVGFFEEDGSKDSAVNEATPGIGRVIVVSISSKNGTRNYDTANPPGKLDSTNLCAIDKLQKFDSLHLSSLNGQGAVPAIGGMARPVIKDNNYDLGNPACVASTGFSWPLQGGVSRYTFSKIINFDPRGVVRIQSASNGDFIPPYIEIGLQSAHGNVTPSLPSDQNQGNHAAIQIDGMTGATRIYRP